jgi:hypothetical protein
MPTNPLPTNPLPANPLPVGLAWPGLQGYLEATGEQQAAYKELAAADAVAAAAIEQRTARLRQLQETLVQVGGGQGQVLRLGLLPVQAGGRPHISLLLYAGDPAF